MSTVSSTSLTELGDSDTPRPAASGNWRERTLVCAMVFSPRAQSAMPVGLQDNSWPKMMDAWALGPENQLEAADPELQPSDQGCFPASLLLETLTTHSWTLSCHHERGCWDLKVDGTSFCRQKSKYTAI